MHTYEVDDMTCGHCAGRITNAVLAVDPAADVRVDLGRHEVIVASTAPAATVESAIRGAGYTPVALTGPTGGADATQRSGCCCAGAARRG